MTTNSQTVHHDDATAHGKNSSIVNLPILIDTRTSVGVLILLDAEAAIVNEMHVSRRGFTVKGHSGHQKRLKEVDTISNYTPNSKKI